MGRPLGAPTERVFLGIITHNYVCPKPAYIYIGYSKQDGEGMIFGRVSCINVCVLGYLGIRGVIFGGYGEVHRDAIVGENETLSHTRC